jgi:signal transduction histidine kinase
VEAILPKGGPRWARCAVTVTRKPGLERAQGAWNRGCLLRIFCNLLQNATKYAPAAPVRVQLARAGDRLRIVFADRGPGISVRAGETAGKYLFLPAVSSHWPRVQKMGRA